MNQKQLAQKVNRKITEWSKTSNKLVVAIDGYTGVGKTTLLSNLVALNPNIIPVHRDDFQISRTKFVKFYRNIKYRPKLFELEMNDSAKLKKLIHRYYKSDGLYKIKTYDGVTGRICVPKVYDFSKKIMVIEGVFMFHPKLLNNLWDKRIYLKADINKIDKRRVAREKKRWGKDYFPETHPDSYFRQIALALERYQRLYRPEKAADIVVIVD